MLEAEPADHEKKSLQNKFDELMSVNAKVKSHIIFEGDCDCRISSLCMHDHVFVCFPANERRGGRGLKSVVAFFCNIGQ